MAVNSLDLSWTASATGTPPISYQPQFRVTGATTFLPYKLPIVGLSVTVDGLSASTKYDFDVIAINTAGQATSAIATGTTAAVGALAPSAPGNLLVSQNVPTPPAPVAPGPVLNIVQQGNTTTTSIQIGWNVPATGTPPYTYNVAFKLSTVTTFPAPAVTGLTLPTYTRTGLTANTTYNFQIIAVDPTGLAGTAAVSGPFTTSTTSVIPGAVGALVISGAPTSNSISLSWNAPTTGTGPFTYNVAYRLDSVPTFGSPLNGLVATSYTQTGLASGTAYDFQVSATNAAGNGPTATAGPSTTTGTPGATLSALDLSPGLTLTNGNQTVTASGAGDKSIRATRPIASGLCYFEVTLNAPSDHLIVGLCTDRYNLSQPEGLGSDAPVDAGIGWTSIGYLPSASFDPGRVLAETHRYVASNVISWGATTNTIGGVIGVAVNLNTFNVWFTSTGMRQDGNTWNNAPPSASNPATGVGGVTLDAIYPGPFFAAISIGDSTSQATANFGATAFSFAVPSGFTSYTSQSIAYPLPIATLPAPTTLNTSAVPTTTTIPLSWAAVSGATNYNLQMYSGQPPGQTPTYVWTTVFSGAATSYTATVPSSSGNAYWFRVQAVNANGSGPWGEVREFLSQPSAGSSLALIFYPDLFSGTTITYAKAINPPDPQASVANPSLLGGIFAPNTPANTFIAKTNNLSSGTLFSLNGFTFVNNALTSVNYPDSKITITPVSANTEYKLYFLKYDSHGLTPAIYIGQYLGPFFVSAPATGSYTGGFNTRLVPPGGEAITWYNSTFVVMPMAATTHFALHYDWTVLTAATASSILLVLQTGVEAIYTQCVTWFGTQANNSPSIMTSLNPSGAKINVVITANQVFAAAHNGCRNADIFISPSNATDLANTNFLLLLVAAELTEVFMTNLSALPDCDLHTVGEGLSIAMAAELYPAASISNTTAAPQAANYMNMNDIGNSGGSGRLTTRLDYVNVNQSGEASVNFPAIGCAALFFSYLVHQLGYTYTQICTALNTLPAFASCGDVYRKLANTTTDPFPVFIAKLNTRYPVGTAVPITFPTNPWPLP